MKYSLPHIFLSGCARLCTAIRFMTILPINWRAEADGENFPSSVIFFPIVGLIIGALGYCILSVVSGHVPPGVAGFLLILYLAVISGGLHLDGLADSGDGLLCSLPRDKRLVIMKDSRMGAMGGIALIIVLLGKYCFLSELTGSELQQAVVLLPLGGRCAILIVMGTVGYGRAEGGIGGLFYQKNNLILALWGGICLTAVTMLLQPQRTLAVVFLVGLISLMFGKWCKKTLGGATGDTLGAVSELGELTVALALTIQ